MFLTRNFYVRMNLSGGDAPRRYGMGRRDPPSQQNKRRSEQQPNGKWWATSASLANWGSWRLFMSPFSTVASSR